MVFKLLHAVGVVEARKRISVQPSRHEKTPNRVTIRLWFTTQLWLFNRPFVYVFMITGTSYQNCVHFRLPLLVCKTELQLLPSQ